MDGEFVSSETHEGALPVYALVRVRFPHDLSVAEQERAASELVASATVAAGRLVIVDLSEADAVYSRFLGALLTLRRKQQERGAEVLLASARPLVRQALERCGLDRLFETFPTVEAAMKAAAVKTG
jgi:anti-anti-sigma factor